MKSVMIVFLGGGLGSVMRYALGKWVNTLHNHQFPWGTFAANVMACAILGFVIGLADHRQVISPSARLFWAVGFCGGFSTYSTFSSETIYLLQNGFNLTVLAYILLSLIVCVSVTFAGLFLGEIL